MSRNRKIAAFPFSRNFFTAGQKLSKNRGGNMSISFKKLKKVVSLISKHFLTYNIKGVEIGKV